MSDERKTILTRVFTDVLEQMAFMFGDRSSPEEFQACFDEMILARMDYRGDLRGTLWLAVPVAMCPELAANFLGTDPENAVERRIYVDALKELLNVTCGNVLTAIAGEEPVFDLTVPEVTELTDSDREAILEDESTAFLTVDEYQIAIRLTSDGAE